MLFGINSVLIQKKNLIASLSIVKMKSHGDEVTELYDK